MFWRRTSRGIERGGNLLADTAGVYQCLQILRDSIAKVVPAEQQVQVLQALGFTEKTFATLGAGAGGVAGLAALATLVVCRINVARAEREAEHSGEVFQEIAINYLANLDRQLAAIVRKGASPDEVVAAIKGAISAEIADQQRCASAQFKLTQNELRHLTSQIGLFAADFQKLSSKIDLISDDVQHRPWLELRRPETEKPDIFFYRDMVIPYVGRHHEWDQLLGFLEANRSFTWWRIIDAGGAGKSRLALELCWHAFVNGWTAGFLQPTAAETWCRWRVTSDTLIVVDYVFARWNPAALGQILDQLAQYSGPYKVRLLVLERSDEGPWWRRFRASDGDRPAERYGHRTSVNLADDSLYGGPMTLAPLNDVDLKTLLGFVLAQRGIEVSDEDLLQHAKTYLELDPKGRPLFAAFYADAISRNPDCPHWSLVDIARNVLQQKLLRQHVAGQGQAPGFVDARHLNLLVLATLVGGISLRSSVEAEDTGGQFKKPANISIVDIMKLPTSIKYLPIRRALLSGEVEVGADVSQLLNIAGYSGDFDDKNLVISNLEPDPLGEALVLERASGRATAQDELSVDAKEATEALLITAGDLAPQFLSAFVERARQDFPEECSACASDLRSFQRRASWNEIPDDLGSYVRLEDVTLWPNQPCDLSSLTRLSNLHTLSLVGRNVKTIDDLAGHETLNWLFLFRTSVSDCSALEDLPSLEHLDLLGSDITSASSLAGLAALRHLSLHYTPIVDISELSTLTSLEWLVLGRTSIANIAALEKMVALKALFIGSTAISEIGVLEKLSNLVSLDICNTPVREFSVLGKLINLRSLLLEGTCIRDISILSGLRKLRLLDLGDTQVDDLTVLHELPSLEEVILPNGRSWIRSEGPPPW